MKIKKLACLVFAIVLAVTFVSAVSFADGDSWTSTEEKTMTNTVSGGSANCQWTTDDFGTGFDGAVTLEFRWKADYTPGSAKLITQFRLGFGGSDGKTTGSFYPFTLWTDNNAYISNDVLGASDPKSYAFGITGGEWYKTVINLEPTVENDVSYINYSMTMFKDDGTKVAVSTEGKMIKTALKNNVSFDRLTYVRFTMYNESITVSEIKISKKISGNAPVAANAEIIGNAKVGEILTAYADISDPDGDKLGLPLYQWKSSADGEIWENIEAANSNVYTPVEADVGKYIAVDITPVSAAEPVKGETVTAKTAVRISAAAAANPSISSVAPNVGNYEAADGKTYKSAVMYFKIAANGWAVDSCGVILKDADGNPLTLNSSYAGDAFAIRVYGNAITEGSAYTFAGFANVSNDGKTEKLVDTEGNFTIK